MLYGNLALIAVPQAHGRDGPTDEGDGGQNGAVKEGGYAAFIAQDPDGRYWVNSIGNRQCGFNGEKGGESP